jgi:hypothetical protein
MQQEVKRRRQEVIPELEKAVKAAKARKAARLKACQVDCRRQKKKIADQAKRAMQKLREHIKRAKERAREACTACKVNVGDEEIDRILRAVAALDKERDSIRELQRRAAATKSKRGRAGGLAAAEKRAESDDAVRFNLEDDPNLTALFNKVRRKIKATPHMSRTEAFLEYVHNHPEELDAIKAEAMEREYEQETEEVYLARKAAAENGIDDLDDEAAEAELRELERAERHLEAAPF